MLLVGFGFLGFFLGGVLFFFFPLGNPWCLFRSRQEHCGSLCMCMLIDVLDSNDETLSVQKLCTSNVLA